MAALIAAVILLAPQQTVLEAELAADDSPFRFEVRLQAETQRLTVLLASGALEPGQVFELWTIPEGGAPVSLGVFEPSETFRLAAETLLEDGALLAVSLEPAGGSPTGQPTGPVVALGTLRGEPGTGG
jgi:anti-sigma-K factor RskA